MNPTRDRIVVRLPQAEEKVTAGGIVLVSNEKEKPIFGEVLAVGPGKTENGVFVPTKIEPGDTVYFSKFSGIPIEIDGEEVLILTEDLVLGTK